MRNFVVFSILLIALAGVGCSAVREVGGKDDKKISDEFLQELITCGKQENYQVIEFQRLAEHRFKNATDNAKCFIKCLFETYGVLKDGEFNEAKYAEVVGHIAKDKRDSSSQNILLKMGKVCRYEDMEERQRLESEGLPPLNDCQRSYNFVTCQVNMIPEKKEGGL